MKTKLRKRCPKCKRKLEHRRRQSEGENGEGYVVVSLVCPKGHYNEDISVGYA